MTMNKGCVKMLVLTANDRVKILVKKKVGKQVNINAKNRF